MCHSAFNSKKSAGPRRACNNFWMSDAVQIRWTRCVHAQLIQCARAFLNLCMMHILSAPQQGESDRGCPHDWGARIPFPHLPQFFLLRLDMLKNFLRDSCLFIPALKIEKKEKENSCTLCLSDLHRFSRLTRKSSNNKQATKTWQLPSHNTAGVKAWQRGGGRNWTLPDIPSFTESSLANLYKKKNQKVINSLIRLKCSLNLISGVV